MTVTVGAAVSVLLLVAVAAYFFGVWAGNNDWLLTGRQDPRYGRTAHCCRGEFYYVIPEGEFCREYVRRGVVEHGD